MNTSHRSNLYVIGAGGVGSWLVPSLCLLAGPTRVTVVDKDILEDKNMNRQLFAQEDLGKSKAEALGRKYGCNHLHQWFSAGLFDPMPSDWLIVCVDNNPSRRDALVQCDLSGCRAIVAANETHSAEAYYYHRGWKNTRLDPRVYYPEIAKPGNDGDPRASSIGCTGEAQRQNVQLVSANFMAAALAQHLYVFWAMEAAKLDKPEEVEAHLPYKLVANLTRLETHLIGTETKE